MTAIKLQTPCGYCQQNNHSQLTLPLEISSITIDFVKTSTKPKQIRAPNPCSFRSHDKTYLAVGKIMGNLIQQKTHKNGPSTTVFLRHNRWHRVVFPPQFTPFVWGLSYCSMGGGDSGSWGEDMGLPCGFPGGFSYRFIESPGEEVKKPG